MKKLLIVSTTFPRWKKDPGPAPFVFYLARAMLSHFRVTVLAPHHPGAALSEDMDGVEVKRFGYGPDRLELLADGAGMMSNMRKSILHKAMAAPFIASELAAVKRELGRGYDFMNSHWMVPSGLLSAIACPPGVRHVVTAHAADFDLLRRMPGGRPLMRYIARRSHPLVCVSPRLSHGVRELVGPGPGVVTQPMGVDTHLFAYDREKRDSWRRELKCGEEGLIMFAGKLSEKKGVEVLLRANATLRDRGTPARLVIVGEGGLRESLEHEAERLGIDDKVTFLGALPNQELAGLYSAADAVTVPSVMDPAGETEGMPVVILEALAAGRPVVATHLCSVPEELVGKGVVEVRANDPAELANALKGALAGEVEVDRSEVMEYDVKNIAARYASLFEEAPA